MAAFNTQSKNKSYCPDGVFVREYCLWHKCFVSAQMALVKHIYIPAKPFILIWKHYEASWIFILLLWKQQSGIKVQHSLTDNLPSHVTLKAGCHGNKINFFSFGFHKKGKQTVKEPSSDTLPSPSLGYVSLSHKCSTKARRIHQSLDGTERTGRKHAKQLITDTEQNCTSFCP